MRLIDADVLINDLEIQKGKCDKLTDIVKIVETQALVDVQPTAYDAEKVIEQIRSEAQLMSEAQLPHKYYKAIGTKKARAIIRKGGVSERD